MPRSHPRRHEPATSSTGTARAGTTIAGNNSGTQVLQENSSGIPSWASVAGTGTVTSVNILDSVGLTVSGTCNSTTAISCTVKQALNNAVTQASPSNPPTTSNTVAFA